MKNIKAVFFDFDGTLADTSLGIVNTMAESFRRMGVNVPEEEVMRQTIGIPLTQALQSAGKLSDKEALRAREIYCDIFMEYEIQKTEMFPNACETLHKLYSKGLRLAIVTSRNRESLEVILNRYNLHRFFETMVTNNDSLPHKPAPDMVLTLLERMGLSNNDVLVVGDTTFDIDMGNNAGCWTCAVTYGNHTREVLMNSHPNYIIDNLDELKEMLI